MTEFRDQKKLSSLPPIQEHQSETKQVLERHSTLPLPTCDAVLSYNNLNCPPTQKISKKELREACAQADEVLDEVSSAKVDVENLRLCEGEDYDEFYLLVVAGGMTGQIFRLNQKVSLLGRSRECEVCLEDEDVSRAHSQLSVLHNKTILLSDLQSTNGTFINGLRIQNHVLKEGDRVQFGRSTIVEFSRHTELRKLFQKRKVKKVNSGSFAPLQHRSVFEGQFQVEFELAVSHQTPLSLFFVECDQCRELEVNFGQKVTKDFLTQMMQIIRSIFRKEDTVALYRDSTFGLIARGLFPTQAAILGERLRHHIEEFRFQVDPNHEFDPSVSIGISTMYTQRFDSRMEMLQQADERLFHALKNGGNQVIAESLRTGW